MSRPSKLTPQVEAVILDALRRGNTRTAAAEAAGLPRETLSRWIARFVTFRHAVTRAEAEAEVAHVANVKKAADEGTWQASVWWLERRRSEDWGRRDRLEVIATVRQLAREHNLTAQEEAEAVAEAVRLMQEHARAARG
jgi:hypothetical protein